MSGLDLNPIRRRRNAALARMLRAGEPDSDRAEDWQPALEAMYRAAIDAANDVAALVAEVDRLRAEVATLTNSEDARAALLERERDEALAEVDRLRANAGPVT